jgi:exosortase E/protease (VPEID-CTERM system)
MAGRAVFLLIVLLAEILAFSITYDLEPLQKSNAYILQFVGSSTAILRVLVVALVALLAIGRARVPAVLSRWFTLSSNHDAFGWLLAGHAVTASCFALLTSHALRPSGSDWTPWMVWLWLVVGGVAVAFWLAAFAPIRFWQEMWRSRNVPILGLSVLIGLSVHLLTLVAIGFWRPLSILTLTVSQRLLHFVADDVVYDPATRMLGTRAFQVEIAPVCSGYEGIGLVTGALALFLIMFRRNLRFPNAFVLLPVGIAAIWFCNALRIVVLILIGSHISEAVAVSGFHSQAGWIGFAFVTLVIGYVALSSPLFAHVNGRAECQGDDAIESHSAAYLLPMLVMIAAAMLATAFSSGFDALYPFKIILGLATLAYFSPVYRGLGWSWSWLAAANGTVVFVIWLLLEPLANASGSQLAAGLGELSPPWQTIWIVFRVLGAVVVVPLAEELAFRGYLLRRMTSAEFESVDYQKASWLAVFVSSVLFGLLHGRWLAGTIAGVFYALAARRRGMLCDAVLAHGITNAMIAIYVLSTQSWHLWS